MTSFLEVMEMTLLVVGRGMTRYMAGLVQTT